ncbi:response regulator [bacterium]|nr:response regulator [bacterium]
MPNKKILIVEGEAIVAKDIQNTLKTLGYDAPAIALSGEEAINKSEEIHPDLVLMDIILKGDMDGIDAAEKICNHFDIPVIYLAAYMDEKTLQRAETTGPFGYILKPFEERELHTTIETTLYRFRDLK